MLLSAWLLLNIIILVEFAKFLKAPILKNIDERLLLKPTETYYEEYYKLLV